MTCGQCYAPTISTEESLGQVTRPARVLLGWLQPTEAHLMLAQRIAQSVVDQAHADRARVARETVAARTPYSEEAQTLSEPGAEISEHIEKLATHADYTPYKAEEWSIKIVDLSKVIALQPAVLWDHALERTSLRSRITTACGERAAGMKLFRVWRISASLVRGVMSYRFNAGGDP